jgi:hypothetical protein
MTKKLCERNALDRFFIIGEMYDKGDELINKANIYQVEAVINGVEEAMKAHGVECEHYIAKHREVVRKAKKEHGEAITNFLTQLQACSIK